MSWIPLGLGVVIVAAGVLLVVRRRWAADFVATMQRATFGRWGEPIASKSTPRSMAAVGIYFVLFGFVMSGLSVASLLGAFGSR
jgi:hypothetical protein